MLISVSPILLLASSLPLMQVLLAQNSCNRLSAGFQLDSGTVSCYKDVIKICCLSQFPSTYYRYYGTSWIKKILVITCN